MRPTAPFVLLDDARPDGAPARLYRDPVGIVRADRIEQVRPALDRIRTALGDGLHAAGYLTYEAGAAFDDHAPRHEDAGTLLWFGLFRGFEVVDASSLADPAGVHVGPVEPLVDRATHLDRLAEIQALITAGDLYQANLTFPARVRIAGDVLALHARLRAASQAGWGALVDTGGERHLSLSPELFFRVEGDRVTCRPMKGTAPVTGDGPTDARAAAAMAADPKQRAENLMIVDLMRNDLSRVAVPGSVEVPDLFTVERYPTVQQMVSTVTARVAPGRDALDVLTALFPCGSITGAPKLRARQVIDAVEGAPRGLYTGAIGAVDPDGAAQFSVAIRTLTIRGDDGHAVLGLGSGIVADSVGAQEWAECLTKAAFVSRSARAVDLIETMAFDPIEGLLRLDRHMARMQASADALGHAFDRHMVRNELQAATFRLRVPARVRLVASASGAVAVEVSPAPTAPPGPVSVAVVPLPVDPADYRLRHKTSDRRFYDAARMTAGCFEVVFADDAGRLSEGSFTNVFVERGDRLVTPPLARGLLPGILRQELIDEGRAVEGELTAADLVQGFWIGNALRGLIPAALAKE